MRTRTLIGFGGPGRVPFPYDSNNQPQAEARRNIDEVSLAQQSAWERVALHDRHAGLAPRVRRDRYRLDLFRLRPARASAKHGCRRIGRRGEPWLQRYRVPGGWA